MKQSLLSHIYGVYPFSLVRWHAKAFPLSIHPTKNELKDKIRKASKV